MATSENANLSNDKWPDIKNRIFDFAFGAALNDATMQRAYSPTKFPGTTTKDDEQKNKDAGLKRDMKKIIADKTKTIVRPFIDKELLDNKLTNQNDFDTAFYRVANDIAGKLSKGNLLKAYKLEYDNDAKEEWVGEFTFGNIQKLINMTVKYMFRVCYLDAGKRKCFNFCHCPMDRIMIEKVFKEYVFKEYGAVKVNKNTRLNDEDGFLKNPPWSTKTGRSNISWSKIGFPEQNGDFQKNGVYENFQKMVRTLAGKENISPIEYDYMHWSAPSEDMESQSQDSAG